MSKNHYNIGVIAHDMFGREYDRFVPVFDSYPHDMHFVCSNQHLKIDTTGEKIIITLVCTDKESNRIEEDIDISSICQNASQIKLCIVKNEEQCELYVYCDYLHNGSFHLSSNFLQKSGLN